MSFRTGAVLIVTAAVVVVPSVVAAQTARDLYARALVRERALRDGARPPTVHGIRSAIAAYERIVRRFPASGYSDNALWQAGNLALLAYERFGQIGDKRTGLRLLSQLKSEYPSSSLIARTEEAIGSFEATKTSARPAPKGPAAPSPVPAPVTTVETESQPATRQLSPEQSIITIRGITRTPLADGIRVSIEMDGELVYRQEHLDNPRRLFFDLKRSKPAQALRDATLKFDDDVVREIRVGRHPHNTTRVVMDTEGVESSSIFTLYNPYRLIVDFRRSAFASLPSRPEQPATVNTRSVSAPPAAGGTLTAVDIDERNPGDLGTTPLPSPVGTAATELKTAPLPTLGGDKPPLPSRPIAAPALPAPTVPSVNSNGQFSIARQLGLGVARVVIDPGHGGHDPGARGSGLNEAELVLDVASRLRQLLQKQPGVEVTMTRDRDAFVPLEERTAIANRQSADLFLSIHANASRNARARGVETYFLNFASNPEAEALAARENSASGKTMHSLPEIVRAIALNNKIDESRDFAEMIQKSMVRTLSPRNQQLRDLGVKQAPFVVLIGAGMPSVLAEISFVTNKQEAQLLKTAAYRQQIAEALLDAVLRYQKSLKARNTIATRDE